ncbi:uncharacterized protein LOC115891469 [Sitophilus oryzae]|uniref:Uncharacterized protein LOC115891469 n=1 Tax=Sitophilus oryzae TaxID=7048 RepID=A0A6J2YUJ0_SITOR|nr:uncharacterized protein LOC115891469 [Sitophilus oryzae]
MSLKNLNETISPAFTEKSIHEMLLNKGELKKIKHFKIDIDQNNQSKKGDSYLSTICKFSIIASGENNNGENADVTLPVIVKSFPKNIARQKTFRSPDFFKTEIDFYRQVWPAMKEFKLRKIANEKDEIPLYLSSYCDGQNDFLALEDLSCQGFKAAGRVENFSLESIRVFLTTLAKFHALSLALKQNNPEFVELAKGLAESYFSEKFRPWYENFMYKSMGPQYMEAAKALLPEKYCEKLQKLFSTDFFGDLCKACKVDNKYCVITQGDAWLPNFLSNTSGGELTCVLIDFQLARYATFTNDLIHFLYCGVPSDMLLAEWDNLIEHYHRILMSRFEELGGSKDYITLDEMTECLKTHALVGVLMALESSVMAILSDDEVADIDLLQGEDAVPLEDVWILPKFNKDRNEKLAFIVKHCVDKGYIP